jgi:hypothetical protein
VDSIGFAVASVLMTVVGAAKVVLPAGTSAHRLGFAFWLLPFRCSGELTCIPVLASHLRCAMSGTVPMQNSLRRALLLSHVNPAVPISHPLSLALLIVVALPAVKCDREEAFQE